MAFWSAGMARIVYGRGGISFQLVVALNRGWKPMPLFLRCLLIALDGIVVQGSLIESG